MLQVHVLSGLLTSRLAYQREFARRQMKRRLLELSNDYDVAMQFRSAARLVLIDGRELLRVVRRPLQLDDSDSVIQFVRDYGDRVAAKLQQKYPNQAEYSAALNRAVGTLHRVAALGLCRGDRSNLVPPEHCGYF
jgi:hypothetical protein